MFLLNFPRSHTGALMRAFHLSLCGSLLIAVAVTANAGRAAAPAPAARIDEALQNITTLVRSGKVGYATFWDGNKYVQCRRQSDRTMRCEAAGAAMQPSLRNVLTGERLNRLVTLGWALDARFGNYAQVFPANLASARIADRILQTLTEAYDADLANLEIQTSWVADVPCPPRNGPTQNLAGIVNDAPQMRATAVTTCSYVAVMETPQKVGSAADLASIYSQTVAAEIQRLRINANRNVFAIFDVGIGYVQCRPHAQPPSLYCEAQSAESWPALASVLTPERVARLHKAGYVDPGRAPNYWKNYAFDKQSDVEIANEILTILYDVYGYAGATKLDIKTK